ncbi:hypothetical protein GQ53DRAFT_876673 [Thozetella sp. PMI_491]|nr:hypothetical protein GQ53DRAFT_876673 [Thozetella sp. PMI_491]
MLIILAASPGIWALPENGFLHDEQVLTRYLGIAPTHLSGTSQVEHIQAPINGNVTSKRVRVKYGPFAVPPAGENGGMKQFLLTSGVTKPCDDCVIIWAKAGLEFTDGTYANANTSMWLHHGLFLNTGVRDSVCPELPERFFASGNERTELVFPSNENRKYGYYVGHDPWALSVELMNQASQRRDAVITLEAGYVPGNPIEYTKTTALWLDITGYCGSAFMKVPSGEDILTFQLDPPWRSQVSGDIITAGGHVHDGGTGLKLVKNQEVICDFVPKYGGDPAFAEPMDHMDVGAGMDSHRGNMTHISSMNLCNNMGHTKQGDLWSVVASYNFTAHAPMLEDGKPGDVMGIAIVHLDTSA